MSGQAGIPPSPPSPGQDPGKQYRAKVGIPILPPLDGLRAVAIVGVVLVHTIRDLFPPGADLGTAVVYGPLTNSLDILFVLSGFVLFLPTAARAGRFGDVGQFLIRRGARLFPGMWLVIVVVLLLIALWPNDPGPAFPGGWAIGVHAIGMHLPAQLVDIDLPVGLSIDGPLWTMSVEILFYLMLPLVAGAFYRHPLRGLVVAAVIAIGWRVAADHLIDLSSSVGYDPGAQDLALLRISALGQFPVWVFHFAAGMAGAMLVVRLLETRPGPWLARRAAWVQIASLGLFVACALLAGRYAIDGTPLSFVDARGNPLLTIALPVSIASFMVAVSLAPKAFQRPLALPVMRWFGDISFGVYLIHVPAIGIVVALLAGAGGPLAEPARERAVIVAIVFAVIVSYAYLSARFVEIPIRRWAHGLRAGASSKPPPSPEPAPAPAPDA